MIKRTILTVAIAMPLMAQATVFQCKVNGQTVFSDRPCGSDAKEIEVKAPARSGTGPMVNKGAQDFLEGRETKSKIERIDRRISDLQNQKDDARRAMDQALLRYQRQKSYANDNLAGATWEGALAQEANVLRERFQSEIDGIDREIDRLREDKRRIQDQARARAETEADTES